MVAAEADDNITTDLSVGPEDYFRDRYNEMVAMTRKLLIRKTVVTALEFGFSELCFYLLWYAALKSGSDFGEKGQCGYREFLRSTLAILFAAITLGNVAIWAPNVGASQLGATHVYSLLDHQIQIDPNANVGEEIERVRGDISTKDVRFEYPRRPDVPVLRGLSLGVERCKTLAIVGESGYGKSTIILLLERFYNIRAGEISIDEHNISEVKVQNLWYHIGLFSQEPELFNRSVFDNIAYGACQVDGNPITMAEVQTAAKLANAHQFITTLSYGYDTMVGPRGESLSGGQRQRVAIARSLIRAPTILLLDEATNWLDSSSERLVQLALECAAAGRTTVVVAHRLSTVKNADIIAVVRKGRVIESVTHDSLLRKNGFYAELVENQLTDVS